MHQHTLWNIHSLSQTEPKIPRCFKAGPSITCRMPKTSQKDLRYRCNQYISSATGHSAFPQRDTCFDSFVEKAVGRLCQVPSIQTKLFLPTSGSEKLKHRSCHDAEHHLYHANFRLRVCHTASSTRMWQQQQQHQRRQH